MFTGQYGGFFGYGDDLADLAVGSRVGPMREVNLKFTCDITPGSLKYSVGKQATPGISKVVAGGITYYTTNQLSQWGLGYQTWWHEPTGHTHDDPDWTQSSGPNTDAFLPTSEGTFSFQVAVRVMFLKINDNFQNTNAAFIPANIQADLFTLYVADTTNAQSPSSGTPVGLAYKYTLTLNSFSSVKRACTPHVNQTIQFDYTTAADL